MTTSLTKNFLPLCILAVLRERADEGAVEDETGCRFLTQSQIEGFVETDFDMPTQRRAISMNLKNLYDAGEANPELGFQLEYLSKERRQGDEKTAQVVHLGWRLKQSSEFETSEVRMLIDAVIASPMVPPNQMKELTAHLRRLAPEHIAVPDAEREGHLPAVNKQFFFNIDMLNEAIRQRKNVRFFLGVFGQDKKLHREWPDDSVREYTVTPVQLLISKGHYYLLGVFSGTEEICKFRIERMLDVEILEGSAPAAEAPSDINILRYREQHSYMMSGKVTQVVLRVSKEGLHNIFDQFGSSVHFLDEQEETVDVELKSAFYSVLFWALQYYRSVEVIAPQELRDELERAAKTIAEMYEGEPGKLSLAERQ